MYANVFMFVHFMNVNSNFTTHYSVLLGFDQGGSSREFLRTFFLLSIITLIAFAGLSIVCSAAGIKDREHVSHFIPQKMNVVLQKSTMCTDSEKKIK